MLCTIKLEVISYCLFVLRLCGVLVCCGSCIDFAWLINWIFVLLVYCLVLFGGLGCYVCFGNVVVCYCIVCWDWG